MIYTALDILQTISQKIEYMYSVPQKGFGSDDGDTFYISIFPSIHSQLIQTFFEVHIVFNYMQLQGSRAIIIVFI